MLDLLKKFEEESVADQLDLDQDDENPSDLVRRLEGVDLGTCFLQLPSTSILICG